MTREQREALGWACICGSTGGMSLSAWQLAAARGDHGWLLLFAACTVVLTPVYFAVQWRGLLG